jgi:RNA polymerase sigma-70 factor (ECF subfamily)
MILLRRYDPRLRRLAMRLLADNARVDRVLARAYMRAWRSLPHLPRGESAAGWLYRIVYNSCLNEMRWEPRRRPPSPPDDAAVLLPAASMERRLLALRALEPSERIPLVLVDGEGFALDDAARMMRRDQAHVAAALGRARGRWRAYVTGEPVPRFEEPDLEAVSSHADTGEMPALTPAATLAALATLSTPTAPREPGGHVRLLAHGTHSDEPMVVAKPPPIPAKWRNSGPRRKGSTPGSPVAEAKAPPKHAKSKSNGSTSEPVPPADDDHRPGPPSATNSAGARRKRRRDAKRAGRPRTPGAAPAANPVLREGRNPRPSDVDGP